MKRVWSAAHPPRVDRVLLIESGSRHLINKLMPALRANYAGAKFDLVTCFPGTPEALDLPGTRVYRVPDYAGREGRARLFQLLRENGYDIAGMLCSGEAVMTKWKWAIAWQLPAKFFAVNENADYFWLDRAHLGVLRHVALVRLGLSGAGRWRTVGRLFALPFTFAFLLLYAAVLHARRALWLLTRGTHRQSS